MHEKAPKFRTQYDRKVVKAHHGDSIHVLRTPTYDERGRMSLVESGKENLYEFIQSHKDSVDIGLMLKRFAAGDAAALSRRQGMYGDFTEVPKTYAEALNGMIKAEAYFNSLPVETRAKFNHSASEFIASIGSSQFAEKLGLISPDPEPNPVTDPEPKGGAVVE